MVRALDFPLSVNLQTPQIASEFRNFRKRVVRQVVRKMNDPLPPVSRADVGDPGSWHISNSPLGTSRKWEVT